MAVITNATEYIKIDVDPDNVIILFKEDAKIEGVGGSIVFFRGATQVAKIKREDVTAPSKPTLTELITTVQGYIDA